MSGGLGARLVRTGAEALLHLFLPPVCPLCRSFRPLPEQPFCGTCSRTLVSLEEPCCTLCATPFAGRGPAHLCPRCRRQPPPFAQVRVFGQYTGGLALAVQQFKYGGQLTLRRALQDLSVAAWCRHYATRPISAVVPVPPHPTTLRRRGCDLAALLARAVARRAGVPVRPRALAKVSLTPDLVTLGARERRAAVARAYAPAQTLAGSVLLVDDVVTTTATARACAQACRDAGAAEVWVLALARTPAGAPLDRSHSPG